MARAIAYTYSAKLWIRTGIVKLVRIVTDTFSYITSKKHLFIPLLTYLLAYSVMESVLDLVCKVWIEEEEGGKEKEEEVSSGAQHHTARKRRGRRKKDGRFS